MVKGRISRLIWSSSAYHGNVQRRSSGREGEREEGRERGRRGGKEGGGEAERQGRREGGSLKFIVLALLNYPFLREYFSTFGELVDGGREAGRQ